MILESGAISPPPKA